MLVDLVKLGKTGKEVEAILDRANITCNKNAIPNDPQSPFVTSGIRLGTAAITSRGFATEDCDKTAEAMKLAVIDNNEEAARVIVKELVTEHPLYEDGAIL